MSQTDTLTGSKTAHLFDLWDELGYAVMKRGEGLG